MNYRQEISICALYVPQCMQGSKLLAFALKICLLHIMSSHRHIAVFPGGGGRGAMPPTFQGKLYIYRLFVQESCCWLASFLINSAQPNCGPLTLKHLLTPMCHHYAQNFPVSYMPALIIVFITHYA